MGRIGLVGHEGSYARGDYAHTLDVVDVNTGWREFRAVENKGQQPNLLEGVYADLRNLVPARGQLTDKMHRVEMFVQQLLGHYFPGSSFT